MDSNQSISPSSRLYDAASGDAAIGNTVQETYLIPTPLSWENNVYEEYGESDDFVEGFVLTPHGMYEKVTPPISAPAREQRAEPSQDLHYENHEERHASANSSGWRMPTHSLDGKPQFYSMMVSVSMAALFIQT